MTHGDVVSAAITSCTNTSNPSVMVAAGLLAKKAVEKGLTRKPWVKTSLAPGSKAVQLYLEESKLLTELEQLAGVSISADEAFSKQIRISLSQRKGLAISAMMLLLMKL